MTPSDDNRIAGAPGQTTTSLLTPTYDVLGIPVAALAWKDALDLIAGHIERREFLRVAWLNAHCSNIADRVPRYRAALNEFLVLPDGVGVDLAAYIRHGRKFPANLNGTDFTPALIRHIETPLRIGLLGARPGVVEKAALYFAGLAPHDIRVISDGFFTSEEEEGVLKKLADFHPDILLVAMGVPRQELFILDKLTERHCTAAFAVGALFDLQTGTIRRAPPWIRRLRAEWLYRLWQEPGRLWRRYIVGNFLFVARLMRERLSGRNKISSNADGEA
ncbi:WecB/TagA/CpsF family glycosyltransferase [Phyllobacterium leguminum]|uniref:Exopolysaccharide biosynthesis WecB/TagA/CpsF family protein n=1 Tax=Phyllobacterium leguminum TaxID=314237 RepID=A0A318T5H9_9HYPH|nr:WecB/TagA/CpsF family glycosyltransferase [Phyllobacterium leguminum]PYE90339.1 exopolysaccharide biosynthesis WecB/TagA/CpsF family protein [Phyllobacterium leguminum]